jgi:hypothetical protein
MHAATYGCRVCTGVSGSGGTANQLVTEKTRATPVHVPCAPLSFCASPQIAQRALRGQTQASCSWSTEFQLSWSPENRTW